jgi:PAS domain S-box-containing protein
MPVAHCVSSTAGTILVADSNFCRLLQRPQSELIGASYRSITVAEDLEKSAEMIAGLLDKAGPTRLRKRYWRPDGTNVEVDLLVSRFDAAGHLVSTLSWREEDAPRDTPLRMWKAALRLKHLYSLKMEEFGRELFGDFPGLILLDLYLAEAEGRLASLEEVAGSAGLSVESVQRWLRVLAQRRLVHPLDGSATLQLGHDGLSKIERLLTAALQPLD